MNYSHIIMRAARLMKRPSVIDPPSGRVPEWSSRWPRDGTETCGGGKMVSGLPLLFLGWNRIYRPERGVGRHPREANCANKNRICLKQNSL